MSTWRVLGFECLVQAASVGVLLITATAEAATYYVAPSGDDAKPGTEAQPFRTVQRGVDIATQPGDTVYVRGGEYPEYVRLHHSGTEGKPITLRNYPGERAVIRAVEIYNNQASAGNPLTIGWIVVEGLELTGEPKPGGGCGIDYSNLHHAVFRNNYIHDMNTHALCGAGHDIRIEGNIIANIGRDVRVDHPDWTKEQAEAACAGCRSYMMYSEGMNYTIVNNLIYGILSYGIHARGEHCAWEDWIANNCPNGCGPTWCPSPEFAWANNWVIANNVFAYHQYASGLVAWAGNQGGGQATNWRIENNIFYQNCTGNPALNPSWYTDCDVNAITLYTGQHTIRNNLFYAPGKTPIYANEYASYTESGNVYNQDPQFTNPFSNSWIHEPKTPDFHLQSTSPAIDAGLNLPAVSTDKEGIARPQGSGYDIGAYEFRSGGSTPLRGDLNGDGKRDLVDVRLLIYMLLGQQPKTPEADLTGDGAVTLADVQALIKLMVGIP